MAARVSERLTDRRSNWMPALGASAIAAFALVIISSWSPQEELPQTVQLPAPPFTTMNFDEDMPDIDFIEDLELLRKLELLRQIEGV